MYLSFDWGRDDGSAVLYVRAGCSSNSSSVTAADGGGGGDAGTSGNAETPDGNGGRGGLARGWRLQVVGLRDCRAREPQPLSAQVQPDLFERSHLRRRGFHVEIFTGGESMTPGVVGASTRAPHRPKDDADSGPLVSFARSVIAAHWNGSAYRSLLELAEACDVPVRWSCRAGICHNCEGGLLSGAVVYGPEPLDQPATGNVLVCCPRPRGDVVLDL